MDDARLIERELSSERVYDGGFIAVDRMTVELPNGSIAARDIVRHVGAAAVVPLDADGNVILVKQYRAPHGRVLLEIPAGKKNDKLEDGLTAAKRELEEETGYTADAFIHLTDLLTTPGFSDEVISLYLATDIAPGDSHPDEDEFLDVVKMPFEEALRMVESGALSDAKTACALLLAREAVKVYGRLKNGSDL